MWNKITIFSLGKIYIVAKAPFPGLKASLTELHRYDSSVDPNYEFSNVECLSYPTIEALCASENKTKDQITWYNSIAGIINPVTWSQNMNGWKIEGFEE